MPDGHLILSQEAAKKTSLLAILTRNFEKLTLTSAAVGDGQGGPVTTSSLLQSTNIPVTSAICPTDRPSFGPDFALFAF